VPAPAPPAAALARPAAQLPVTPLAVPDPPAVVGAMLLRGEALLAIGDISGARRFFERAAASGNAAAAFAMGGTYDPGLLATIGARGITPDAPAALAWYRYAATLGETRAAGRIAALEGSR
jgi:TPR repeat protein